jgi:hypothetical protein
MLKLYKEKGEHMKITSNQLIAIDRFMDRSFVFSVINNVVNLVIKAILNWQAKNASPQEKNKPLTNYWTYIAQKDTSTCGLGLIPFLGSVFILGKNALETVHANSDFLKIKKELGIEEDDLDTFQESDIMNALQKLDPHRQAHIWKSEKFVHLIQNGMETPPEFLQIPVEQLYKMGQLSSVELVTDEEATTSSLKDASFLGKSVAYIWAAGCCMQKN